MKKNRMRKRHFLSDEIPAAFSRFPACIKNYIQITRPYHYMAGVFPCLTGIGFSTNVTNDLYWYCVFAFGGFFILSAGEIINDFFDRFIDAKYFKTMARPIPSGRIKTNQAILYFILNLLAAFYFWLLLPNSIKAATLIELGLICIYPFFKRFANITQFYLGLIAGLPLLFPYYMFENGISLGAFFMFLGSSMVCVIFDTTFEYAEYFSNQNSKIRATTLLFKNNYKRHIYLCILIHYVFLFLAGLFEDKNFIFFIGASLSPIFMAYIIYSMNFNRADECRENFLKLQFSNAILLATTIIS